MTVANRWMNGVPLETPIRIINESRSTGSDIVEVTYECSVCGIRTVSMSDNDYEEHMKEPDKFCPHTPD